MRQTRLKGRVQVCKAVCLQIEMQSKIKLQRGATKLRSALLNIQSHLLIFLMEEISRRLSSVVRRLYFMDFLKCTIISKIKVIPVSARTIQRCITELVENVSEQQTVTLKGAPVFSVALDESGYE